MRWSVLCLFFSLFFMINVAEATVVLDLNVVTVAVANASSSARQAVLPKALGQVLVKLSGNPAVMTVPAIQNALDDMDSLIQSYAYLNQEQADGKSQLQLQIRFDLKALKQLLQRSGQADWPDNRPLALLWIQVPDQYGSTILSNTNDTPVSQVVKQTAKLRGVPILLPTMDLQDQSLLNKETSTFDQALLTQVSHRYGAAAVLAGRIQQNGTQWQGSWLLLMNDTPYQWRNSADSMNTLLQRSINDMVNLMANQLSVTDNKDLQADVTLDISNVQNLDDYAKALQAIRHLTPVTGASIKDMNGSDLLLLVKTIGGEQALITALSLQSRFIALDAADDSSGNADLFYRWRGEGNQNSG